MTREMVFLQPVMSFAEIAAEMGVSRQRALQIYNSAIRKLRAHGMVSAREMSAHLNSRRRYADNTDGVEAFLARWED